MAYATPLSPSHLLFVREALAFWNLSLRKKSFDFPIKTFQKKNVQGRVPRESMSGGRCCVMGPKLPQVPLKLQGWIHIPFSWGRETLNIFLFRDPWSNRSQCPKAAKAGKSLGFIRGLKKWDSCRTKAGKWSTAKTQGLCQVSYGTSCFCSGGTRLSSQCNMPMSQSFQFILCSIHLSRAGCFALRSWCVHGHTSCSPVGL